jgi:histidinol-phosphatase (PHP family)
MHFDSHVHSAASPDSQMPPEVAINLLHKRGLGIIFTEHCDFVTQNDGRDFSAADIPRIAGDFLVDFEQYEREYRPLRSKSVLLGLEFTLSAAFLPLNTKTAAGDYDFILGAVHTVEGLDLYHDACKQEPRQLLHDYLVYAEKMVRLNTFFDSLAHIDYICRYAPGMERIFAYESFPHEFDALLRTLADQGRALEINTARLNKRTAQQALFPIYKRFAALGGRFVTIGSDAHEPHMLGRNFDEGFDIAREAGLRVVNFVGRKKISF